MADRTKRLIAHTLKEMMGETPLCKIRVGDLCKQAGIGRQTFYYHFHDKYEVVAWIFEEDYRKAALATGGGDGIVTVASALQSIWEDRDFYREAFSDRSEDSISHYIQRFDVRLMRRLVLDSTKEKELTPWQDFAIRHHSYGSIGCTLDWLQGALTATPDELAAWEFAVMPDFIRNAFAYADAKRDGKGERYPSR